MDPRVTRWGISEDDSRPLRRQPSASSCTCRNAHFSFFYGNPGDVILAGDWDGDGDDTVAVYRPATGKVYVNLENSSGAADYTLYVGSFPIASTWGRQ